MSGVRFTMLTPEVDLVAATAKTIIEVTAAANHRVLLHEIRVMFKGTTVGNEPVTVEEIVCSVSGTGTAGTPRKRLPDDPETLQTSFEHSLSGEPTVSYVLGQWYIHPTSGIIQPLPLDKPIVIPGGDIWGLRLTADDAVVAMAHLEAEE